MGNYTMSELATKQNTPTINNNDASLPAVEETIYNCCSQQKQLNCCQPEDKNECCEKPNKNRLCNC